MEIVVDGVIYQLQPRGGISRIYDEVFPRMCELDPGLLITLLTKPALLQQPLPSHPRIRHRHIPRVEHYLRPSRLWARLVPRAMRLAHQLTAGSGKGTIWHSTYYTVPEKWQGKQVVTVLDMIYERFDRLFSGPADQVVREAKRRAVLAADAVICISETTRQDVLETYGLSADRTHVVPLAAASIFKRAEDTPSLKAHDRPFLLYVGRRDLYKNFDTLLSAYANWPGTKDVDLIAAGGGNWSPEETARLKEFNLAGRVHLLPNVDDVKLRSLYNQAVAFVYPSQYEGFGIPLLEAMACGCPVIASNIPSTIEVAGDCAVYFETLSSDDLMRKLDQVWSEDRDGPRQAKALELAQKYSWDETARKTLEVYRAI